MEDFSNYPPGTIIHRTGQAPFVVKPQTPKAPNPEVALNTDGKEVADEPITSNQQPTTKPTKKK